MKWMFKLLILSAALWSGYWFVGAKAQEELFTSIIEEGRDRGWTAESRNLGVQGFPNRFDTTLTNLNFQDPTGRWGWRGESFQIKALSYQLNHVIVAWPGEQVIDTPEGSLTVNAELLRASVVLAPNAGLSLARVQIEGTEIDLQSSRGWAAKISDMNGALHQDEAVPTRYRLGIDASDITPPSAFTSILGGGSSLPALVDKLHISAVVDFDREIDRHAFASGAPPKPVSALVEPSLITWGRSELLVSGELSANAGGYVDGFLQFEVKNWQPFYDVFKQASSLTTTEKISLKRALDAASNGGALNFTLTFTQGETRIGPIRIGPAPVYR